MSECVCVQMCLSSVYRTYLFKWKTFEIKLLESGRTQPYTNVYAAAAAATVCFFFFSSHSQVITNKYVAIETFNKMMRLFKFTSIS